MEKRRIFKISFRSLLSDICENLALPKPIYNLVDISKNNVYVVARKSDSGPMAFFFLGKEKKNLVESEEEAAEKAVMFLVKRYNIRVDDINLEKKERYKSCYEFYKVMRKKLENLKRGLNEDKLKSRKDTNLGKYATTISINYRDILADILRDLKISSTNIESCHCEAKGYVCSFALGVEYSKGDVAEMEWLIGDSCDTLKAAEQSLAKKAITFLQPLYNFDVKDVNYFGVAFADFHCAFQRESYLTIKERVIGIKEDIDPHLTVVEHECVTPKGIESQIKSSNTPPPAPKKPRPSLKALMLPSIDITSFAPTFITSTDLAEAFRNKDQI